MERDVLAAALGVGPDPTTGEIRAARRVVAGRLHPDRTGTDRTRTLMAEVNAACDRWIAEIRSRPRRQPSESAESGLHLATVTDHPRPRPAGAPRLRAGDVVATLGLLIIVAVLTVVIVGPSMTTGAVGLVLGSVASTSYMITLHRIRSVR